MAKDTIIPVKFDWEITYGEIEAFVDHLIKFGKENNVGATVISLSSVVKHAKVKSDERDQVNEVLPVVTNSTLRKCCDNPDINEIESQNTDCDGDYESCTITYCKSCKQTLSIAP